MPRIFLALLGLVCCAVASAATVEKLTIDGKAVTVKVPDKAAPGKPWLWVGEFGGHHKSLEDGLVEKGWHVVYVGVSNQFGSARSMAASDDPAHAWVRQTWTSQDPRLPLVK